jgi:hypothetical protein
MGSVHELDVEPVMTASERHSAMKWDAGIMNTTDGSEIMYVF